MVSYEGEIDSVILTHCRYSLSFGKGQEVEYDFAALEKHIYDRFLVTKPEIDGSSQPLMMYTSDVIRQDIFQQLRDKIKPQVSCTLCLECFVEYYNVNDGYASWMIPRLSYHLRSNGKY